jgi:hypothetical protein
MQEAQRELLWLTQAQAGKNGALKVPFTAHVHCLCEAP